MECFLKFLNLNFFLYEVDIVIIVNYFFLVWLGGRMVRNVEGIILVKCERLRCCNSLICVISIVGCSILIF